MSKQKPLSKALKAKISAVSNPHNSRYGDNGTGGRSGVRPIAPITLPHAEVLARHGIGIGKQVGTED